MENTNITDVDRKWMILKNNINKTAETNIGKAKRCRCKDRWNEMILDEKAKARKKLLDRSDTKNACNGIIRQTQQGTGIQTKVEDLEKKIEAKLRKNCI